MYLGIRIRIRTKMSRIPNTGFLNPRWQNIELEFLRIEKGYYIVRQLNLTWKHYFISGEGLLKVLPENENWFIKELLATKFLVSMLFFVNLVRDLGEPVSLFYFKKIFWGSLSSVSITLARKSLVLELNNDCALNDIDIGQEPKVCCQFKKKRY